jgi:hypothetical protein
LSISFYNQKGKGEMAGSRNMKCHVGELKGKSQTLKRKEMDITVQLMND